MGWEDADSALGLSCSGEGWEGVFGLDEQLSHETTLTPQFQNQKNKPRGTGPRGLRSSEMLAQGRIISKFIERHFSKPVTIGGLANELTFPGA